MSLTSQRELSPGSDSGSGVGGQAVHLGTHPAVLDSPSPRAGPMPQLVAAQDSERPFVQE